MSDDLFVSKPPAQADLHVLCIDGTRPTDSAAFFTYLEKAGKRIKKSADRVLIQNLLSLVGISPDGNIRDPAKSGDSLFPFGTDHLKTLPIKKVSLPGSRQRIALVLLPQGEVLGDKTRFSDPSLGSSEEEREEVAKRNSNLLKRICLAPGISKAGTASAHLDFATAENVSTDILYLSGHGSMAGTVCGEADTYMTYFELLQLVNDEFGRIGTVGLVPPLWMVTGACFSLRSAHGEIWLRFFEKQRVPLRGILGYQTTSPLADASAEINRRFANALAEGKTFIKAWQSANANGAGWTALAFDYAANDTLTSLRDLKAASLTSSVPPPGKRTLLFHQQNGEPTLVRIQPPKALLEIHHFDKGIPLLGEPGEPPTPSEPSWRKILVSNLDFTEESYRKEAEESGGTLVTNNSWTPSGLPDAKRLVDLGKDWRHEFVPGFYYAIEVFPPFSRYFEKGFQPGDEIEISVVHVRQTYRKAVNFHSIFSLVGVNGQKYSKVAYTLPRPDGTREKQSGRVRNRIRFVCPMGPASEPARIVVQFKKEAASQHYLWFWFEVKIVRDDEVIFSHEFDNYIMTISHDTNQEWTARPPDGDNDDPWDL
jgi:hypothetical protein